MVSHTSDGVYWVCSCVFHMHRSQRRALGVWLGHFLPYSPEKRSLAGLATCCHFSVGLPGQKAQQSSCRRSLQHWGYRHLWPQLPFSMVTASLPPSQQARLLAFSSTLSSPPPDSLFSADTEEEEVWVDRNSSSVRRGLVHYLQGEGAGAEQGGGCWSPCPYHSHRVGRSSGWK